MSKHFYYVFSVPWLLSYLVMLATNHESGADLAHYSHKSRNAGQLLWYLQVNLACYFTN